MIFLRKHAIRVNLNIIEIYVPTAYKEETTIEEFYEQLERPMKMTNKYEIKIITGDFIEDMSKGKKKK